MTNYFSRRLVVFVRVLVAGAIVAAACGTDVAELPAPAAPAAAPEVSATDLLPSIEVVPLDKPLEAPSEVPEELQAIWDVWAILTRDHVDRSELDPEAFTEAAIRGMLNALGDPHTNYVRPEAFEIESGDLQGKFEGIGANVSMRLDGKLQIVAPIKGSPAEAAGLRPADVILEVDGVSIVGLSLLEAVARIRGPRGTTVDLLVQHLGALDPEHIFVVRDVIPLESVLLRSEPGDRIAHIRITSFYADTSQNLAASVREAIDTGAEALILDVRDNPGGLLQSVVDVTSQFLDEGLVLYEVDGVGRRTNWNVRNTGETIDVPMVVLTNEFSASASEILAGALQDYGRATVVGATTFGKGSVNVLRRLSNDGGLYVTFARWFTPLGRPIDGEGVSPDVEVAASDRRQAEAKQLEKAIDILESQLATAKAGSSTS